LGPRGTSGSFGPVYRVVPHVLIIVLSGALLLPTRTARAWTETDIQSVAAEVSLRPDGGARVVLDVMVRVRRGWLEGLEVTGLDPNLVLDPDAPPRWQPVLPAEEDADAREAAPPASEPEVQMRGGRLQLTFPRRSAPRPGSYRATVTYFTTVTGERTRGDRIRIGWTLPAWRSGLDDVTVRVHGPPGTRAAAGAASAPSNVTITRTEEGSTAVVTFHRTHLPRTLAWRVEVEVPARAMEDVVAHAASAGVAASASPPSQDHETPPLSPTWPWPLALLALGIALGKLLATSRACRGRRVPCAGLVPLPRGLRAAACVAATLAAIPVYAAAPVVGVLLLATLPLLVWERPPATWATPPGLGAFRRAGRRDLGRTRHQAWRDRLAPAALLDMGSPLGALVLVGATAAAWATCLRWASPGPWTLAHLVLTLLPLGLAASPRVLPRTPEQRLALLHRLATKLRWDLVAGPPLALALRIYEGPEGRWEDARLRCELAQPAEGLVHLDVAVAHERSGGELRSEPVLLAVTRTGSPADERLAAALPGAARMTAPGGRTAHVLAFGGDPARALAAAMVAASDDGSKHVSAAEAPVQPTPEAALLGGTAPTGATAAL
jgi:hypothetical protein